MDSVDSRYLTRLRPRVLSTNDHDDSISVDMCADRCSSKYSDDFTRACVSYFCPVEQTDAPCNDLSVLDFVSNVYLLPRSRSDRLSTAVQSMTCEFRAVTL